MSHPKKIDLSVWSRAEHFAYYSAKVPCTYATTVQIDVTALTRASRAVGRKAYAAQIWALAAVVNRHEEFRLTLDEDGSPATWPVVHPSFTVFNPERETFSCLWTPFDDDFAEFHARAAGLMVEHRRATTMFPQGDLPPDSFDISSLPWTSFTAFDLHIDGGSAHLLPIFTLGRLIERDPRTLLPVAIQVHHAAADGFHVARLVNDLRVLVAEPDWVG